MGVSLKQEKPPQTKGLLTSLASGKKEHLKFVCGLPWQAMFAQGRSSGNPAFPRSNPTNI